MKTLRNVRLPGWQRFPREGYGWTCYPGLSLRSNPGLKLANAFGVTRYRMRVEPIKKRFLTRPGGVRVPARAPRWVMPAVRSVLVVTDLLLALTAFVLAFYLREGKDVFQAGSFWWTGSFAPYAALLPIVVITRLLTLANYDLYKLRGEFSLVDEGLRIFKATAVGSLLIVAAAFLYRGGFEYRSFSYSRGVFVADFLLAFLGFGAVRLLLRSAQTLVRKRGLNLIPTLVVGCGPEAELFIREISERPQLGYRVIGVVENLTGEAASPVFAGVPVIGGLEDLGEAIRESNADEVIITDPAVPGDVLFEVMMQVGRQGVEFRISPSLFNVLPRKTEIDQIGALPMISLFRSPLSSAARVAKRMSDILIAASASLVLFPVSLLVAILIKLDSRGPVLYRQERVGMDGRIFLFYKFRTMKVNADDSLHREAYRKNIAGLAEANDGDRHRPIYGKLREDPRITRVGRVIRRISLDEVPQLLNVLRGEMSIVGPRPPIPYEVESYDLWHRKRLDMKPGLTGLWQVSGRNRLPFEEMVKLDLFYIENWSLLFDLKIILRTVLAIVRGDGY